MWSQAEATGGGQTLLAAAAAATLYPWAQRLLIDRVLGLFGQFIQQAVAAGLLLSAEGRASRLRPSNMLQ
jgi:hypothetical protein